MTNKKQYTNDKTRILLNTAHGSTVIAIAADAEWARIIVSDLNQYSVKSA